MLNYKCKTFDSIMWERSKPFYLCQKHFDERERRLRESNFRLLIEKCVAPNKKCCECKY